MQSLQTLPVYCTPALSQSSWPPSHNSIHCQAILTQTGNGPAGPDGCTVIQKCLWSSCQGSLDKVQDKRQLQITCVEEVSQQILTKHPLCPDNASSPLAVVPLPSAIPSASCFLTEFHLKSLSPNLPDNSKPTTCSVELAFQRSLEFHN